MECLMHSHEIENCHQKWMNSNIVFLIPFTIDNGEELSALSKFWSVTIKGTEEKN